MIEFSPNELMYLMGSVRRNVERMKNLVTDRNFGAKEQDQFRIEVQDMEHLHEKLGTEYEKVQS